MPARSDANRRACPLQGLGAKILWLPAAGKSQIKYKHLLKKKLRLIGQVLIIFLGLCIASNTISRYD
jgi:hypothetical protein